MLAAVVQAGHRDRSAHAGCRRAHGRLLWEEASPVKVDLLAALHEVHQGRDVHVGERPGALDMQQRRCVVAAATATENSIGEGSTFATPLRCGPMVKPRLFAQLLRGAPIIKRRGRRGLVYDAGHEGAFHAAIAPRSLWRKRQAHVRVAIGDGTRERCRAVDGLAHIKLQLCAACCCRRRQSEFVALWLAAAREHNNAAVCRCLGSDQAQSAHTTHVKAEAANVRQSLKQEDNWWRVGRLLSPVQKRSVAIVTHDDLLLRSQMPSSFSRRHWLAAYTRAERVDVHFLPRFRLPRRVALSAPAAGASPRASRREGGGRHGGPGRGATEAVMSM